MAREEARSTVGDDPGQVAGHDREAGRALRALLGRLAQVRPDDIATVARLVEAEVAWIHHAELYLVDYDHTVLRRLATGDERASPAEIPTRDGAAAGVFRSQAPWWEASATAPGDGPPGAVLWVPLTNRWRRLGVARFEVDQPLDAGAVAHRSEEATAVGSGLAQVLDTVDAYTDALRVCRRRRDLSLSAEMQWELLPPLTLETPTVAVAGLMEPAYDVGGDCFDYASNGDALELAIFDPVGHSVASSMTASLTMGTYRHARRNGLGLAEIGARLDEVIASHVGRSTFVTGLLVHLDTTDGVLRWVNGGHPLPLWWRAGRLLPWPEHRPDRPFGLGHQDSSVHAVALAPGDRVLLFTDGVIEARSSDGIWFGVERLGALLLQHAGAGLDAVDSLRSVLQSVVDHHAGGRLRDDASMVVLEWRGPPPGRGHVEA